MSILRISTLRTFISWEDIWEWQQQKKKREATKNKETRQLEHIKKSTWDIAGGLWDAFLLDAYLSPKNHL